MRKVLKVRRYKAGYEIRTILITGEEAGGGPDITMKQAFTPDGQYIGSSKWAHRLIVKRGIKPESRKPDCPEANGGWGRTCSIGLCEREQKWFGWSHRAMYGFGIGSEVKEGDCCASSGWTQDWLDEHPDEDLSLPVGFIANTLDDCKRMAIAFADSVS